MDLDDLLKRPERWARVMGWATFAGLFFAFIGPFGSYESNIFTRIAYWTALFWVGALLLWPCVVATIRYASRKGIPPVFAGVAVVLAASIPLAALGALVTWLCWPVRASGMKLLEWYELTILVALPAMAGLVWFELGKKSFTPDGRSRDPADGRAHAATTIPDYLLEAALCLQMEDHHVRIHVSGRSYLQFGLMRDVVASMEQGRGLQVHRSWWVARDAVSSWYRDGRSVVLILSNDLHVPVARNRVAILRAGGWLNEP